MFLYKHTKAVQYVHRSWDQTNLVLNSKEKVNIFAFLNVYVSWIERNKISCFQLQNSDSLQAWMAQRREPLKMNFDNFQIKTKEKKMKEKGYETNDHIVSFVFWVLTVCNIHFWKLSKFLQKTSRSPPFSPFWLAKHLNFGGESCKIRILSRSIQETYTLGK